jgi:hypothetical protein
MEPMVSMGNRLLIVNSKTNPILIGKCGDPILQRTDRTANHVHTADPVHGRASTQRAPYKKGEIYRQPGSN